MSPSYGADIMREQHIGAGKSQDRLISRKKAEGEEMNGREAVL
jgi:hypothetical protein